VADRLGHHDIPAVIAAAFGEAERRDPGHARPWIALVDGDRHQIEVIRGQAAARGITVTILVDLCRARDYADSRGWPGREALPGWAS
jgi:hypothetical protein